MVDAALRTESAKGAKAVSRVQVRVRPGFTFRQPGLDAMLATNCFNCVSMVLHVFRWLSCVFRWFSVGSPLAFRLFSAGFPLGRGREGTAGRVV